MSQFIKVAEKDHVATVALVRNEKLNALHPSIIDELISILQRLEKKESVKAIVLTGSGKSFIVGADIHVMKDLGTFSSMDFISKLHELMHLIRYHEKAIIAAVNGYCYGAGLEVAISCDIVVASEQATFGMQEVKIGIPSVIEAALLPFTVGLLKTKEMLLTGEVIDAKEAKEIGLVNKISTHDELMDTVICYAHKITENPSYSVAMQKRLINRWMENAGLEQSVKNGIDSFGIAFGKEETNYHLSQALKGK